MSHIDWDKVKIEGHSAEVAAKFLKEHPENAEDHFLAAKMDRVNGITHFELGHDGEHPGIGHHFTLEHHGDGSYTLRRREHY